MTTRVSDDQFGQLTDNEQVYIRRHIETIMDGFHTGSPMYKSILNAMAVIREAAKMTKSRVGLLFGDFHGYLDIQMSEQIPRKQEHLDREHFITFILLGFEFTERPIQNMKRATAILNIGNATLKYQLVFVQDHGYTFAPITPCIISRPYEIQFATRDSPYRLHDLEPFGISILPRL